MTLNDIKVLVSHVFGDDYHRVRILVGHDCFKLEIKDMIHDGVWIRSEQNALDKISDLYYDMTCENFSWGLSK